MLSGSRRGVPVDLDFGTFYPLNFAIFFTQQKEDNMDLMPLVLLAGGIIVGIGAAATGLGGGFLMVPLLLFYGFTAQKAIGTSFMAILIISASALIAHSKMANVDYKFGLLLGVGGVIGAQIGARLIEDTSTETFKKIFAVILIVLAGYLFIKK